MFTQFEDVEGYVVSASDPPGVMTDQFKDIGYHFLPDRGLCWRLITMSLGDFKMIGVPVHIEDSKYARRAFVFCFCLVVENNPLAIKLGKTAAQALADLFHSLEIDLSFLSENSDVSKIAEFIRIFRERLNSDKSPFVNLTVTGDYRVQFGKPVVTAGVPAPIDGGEDTTVKGYYTPVAIVDVSSLTEQEAASNHVLVNVIQACTGLVTVAEISVHLELDFSALGSLLRVLERRQLIILVNQPIDQFTRVRLTSVFHSFFDDLSNRQEAIAYTLISDPIHSGNSTPRSDQGPISNLGDYLVRMYCRLDGHTQDLGEFHALHHGGNISSRHMVVFGLIKNFLRCKTMYPVFPDSDTTMIPVLRSCDGRLSWDELGCKYGLTRSELSDVFTHHNVLQIWR